MPAGEVRDYVKGLLGAAVILLAAVGMFSLGLLLLLWDLLR